MNSRRSLPWGKKVAFSGIIFFSVLFLLEAGARVAFYLSEGRNPYYLTFGLLPDTEYHSLQGHGYSKFQPDTYIHQKRGSKTIRIKINANGFRGLRDFVRRTRETDLRVATLGASSTFGYYVEDDQTYSYKLERILQATFPEKGIEVMNLGIPHARIENIVALARKELPALQPDVVTLYAGYNNATHPREEGVVSQSYRVKNWLIFHSVLWRVFHAKTKELYYSFIATTNKDPVELPHLNLPIMVAKEEIERLRREVRQRFRANIDELKEISTSLGARLIPVLQNYNMRLLSGSGLEDRWRSYEEQLEVVENIYRRSGRLGARQVAFLIHTDLMRDLRTFAREHNLTLVDGIAALRRNPSQMLSPVHLSPLGNRGIAEAIASKCCHD